jgi:hypothetical protein
VLPYQPVFLWELAKICDFSGTFNQLHPSNSKTKDENGVEVAGKDNEEDGKEEEEEEEAEEEEEEEEEEEVFDPDDCLKDTVIVRHVLNTLNFTWIAFLLERSFHSMSQS